MNYFCSSPGDILKLVDFISKVSEEDALPSDADGPSSAFAAALGPEPSAAASRELQELFPEDREFFEAYGAVYGQDSVAEAAQQEQERPSAADLAAQELTSLVREISVLNHPTQVPDATPLRGADAEALTRISHSFAAPPRRLRCSERRRRASERTSTQARSRRAGGSWRLRSSCCAPRAGTRRGPPPAAGRRVVSAEL